MKTSVICFLAILIVSPVVLYAQQSGDASLILIHTEPEQADADDRYTDVISSFLFAAMEAQQYQASVASRETGIATGNRQSAIDFALGQGNSYILITRYRLGTGSMELGYQCIDVTTGEVIAEGTATARPLLLLDATLDEIAVLVVSALGRIIPPGDVAEAQEADTLDVTQEPPAVDLPADKPVDAEQQENNPEPEPTPTAPERPGFSLLPEFGIFRSLGNADSYFRRGLAPGLSGYYNFPGKFGTVAVGLSSGTVYFESEGDQAGTSGFLTPVAVSGYYSTSNSAALNFTADLSAGVGIISVKAAGAPMQSKWVPFASGSMGFLLFRDRNIALGLSLEVKAFFEQPTPIIGYALLWQTQVRQQ